MASGTSLRFTVEVAADQATGALNALSAAFNKAGIDANTKLLGMGRASREAANEVSGLSGKLKEFASEQRQQGRVANFYVRELAEIAPVSDTVKVALGGVVGALAGGFGLGMAIDLVVTGAKLLVDHLGKAAKEAEAFAKDSAKAIDDLDKRIDALRNKTGAEKAQGEWQLTRMQVDERRELIKALEAENEAERQNPASLRNDTLIAQNARRIQQASEEIVQLDRRAEKLQKIVKLEVLGADSKAAEDAARKKEEAQKKAGDLASKRAQDEYNIAHTLERQTSALQRQAEVLAAEGRNKVAEDAKKGTGELSALPNFGGPGGLDKLLADAANKETEHNKALAKEQDAYNKKLDETAKKYEQWGNVAGGVVTDVITGQMSVADAVASVGRMVIQTLVQMLIQKAAMKLAMHELEKPVAISEVMNAAGVAGANAAASVAATPFIGPVLAAAAMAETSALVLGSMLPLASAAGGMMVPEDMIAQVHKDERVLPARYSKGLDRLVESGGGRPIVVNINTPDGDSVARFFKKNDVALVRAIRDAAARGA